MRIIFLLLALIAITTIVYTQKLSAKNSNKVNISVQLYSVKDDLKNDFKGTLSELAKIGFNGVEFAGNYGGFEDNPKELKNILNELNLEVAGAHLKMPSLRGENLIKTIFFAKAIGCKYLIVPWDDRVMHKEAIKELAEELNQLSKTLAPHGLKIGYHNHDEEMEEVNGVTRWDTLATLTNKDVILQQDVGWTTYAGKDPVYYVNKYPGRTLSTHYKAKLPKGTKDKLPIIGLDTTNWSVLLKANIKNGGTQWYTIEQEDYPDNMTPMQCVEASYKGLRKILSELN